MLMSLPCTTKILENYQPTLEEAQKEVGGYVEMIRVEGGQLLVNEEGRLKGGCSSLDAEGRLKYAGLSLNPTASEIAGQEIVGNALFLKGSAQWE